jgi:drug/metabolite transporter (DMT)-like permease
MDFSYFGLKMFFQLPKESRTAIYWRTFYGLGSFMGAAFSIYFMPVSVSVSIQMTAVFFTAILAWLIANEPLSLFECFIILGGFIGVLIITNQNFFEEKSDL